MLPLPDSAAASTSSSTVAVTPGLPASPARSANPARPAAPDRRSRLSYVHHQVPGHDDPDSAGHQRAVLSPRGGSSRPTHPSPDAPRRYRPDPKTSPPSPTPSADHVHSAEAADPPGGTPSPGKPHRRRAQPNASAQRNSVRATRRTPQNIHPIGLVITLRLLRRLDK